MTPAELWRRFVSLVTRERVVFQESSLAKVDVEIVSPSLRCLRCLRCGALWVADLGARGWWKCPGSCNG